MADDIDDLTNSDPSNPRQKLPEGGHQSMSPMEKLRAPKSGLGEFQKASKREEQRHLGEFELDDDGFDELDLPVDPDNVEFRTKKPKVTPMPRDKELKRAQDADSFEDELEVNAGPKTSLPMEAKPTHDPFESRPASVVAEELRRPSLVEQAQEANFTPEGGEGPRVERPKPKRAVDFEPEAWGSSKTKVDRNPNAVPLDLPGCAARSVGCVKGFFGRLNLAEMASVALCLCVAVAGLVVFLNMVNKTQGSPSEAKSSLELPSFPVSGRQVTIAQVDSFWRKLKAGDISKPDQVLLPEVQITLSGGSGFLRVFFRDEKGKLRGDPMTYTVGNGQVDGRSSVSSVCTEGYTNPMDFVWFRADQMDGWTFEILESLEYDAPPEQWQRLILAEMAPREGE